MAGTVLKLGVHPMDLLQGLRALGDVVPMALQADVRDDTVDVGLFTAPDGFPWRVSLVRSLWCTARRRGRTPPRTRWVSVQLLPQCLPRFEAQKLSVPFDAWYRAETRTKTRRWVAREVDVKGWRPLEPLSPRLEDRWGTVCLGMRALDDVLSDFGETDLVHLVADAPWTLALSNNLLHAALHDLQLPDVVLPHDALVACRAARGGWYCGLRGRRRISDRWLRAGAYEQLSSEYTMKKGERRSKSLVGAFLDGLDPLEPLHGGLVARAASEQRAIFANRAIYNTILPVHIDRTANESADWVVDWLAKGDGWAAMWLVLGRAMRRLWLHAAEPSELGSVIAAPALLRDRLMQPRLVKLNDDGAAAWRLEWRSSP